MSGRRCAFAVAAALALPCAAGAQDRKVNTIKEMFSRFDECTLATVREIGMPPVDISVRISLKRNGELIGPPKITYESRYMTDEQSLHARTVVKDTLQRCLPMPFTDEMGGAAAGHGIILRFDMRRLKSTETRPWLTTTTL